jgi:basic membrane protein A
MRSTRLTRRAPVALATAAVLALSVGCSNNAESAAEEGETEETVLEGQPDLNGDGDVKIGVLSPGDLNDNGYYESFVVKAQEFADAEGWEILTVGSINPADSLEQARNMCRQGVDMVALAAAELADAIPASTEAVCEGTAWYVPSSGGSVEVTPEITLSEDDANEVLLAAGYGMGLLMREAGETKAGFVSGPELDFSIIAGTAYRLGIEEVIPDAEVLTTYTGDFDDSGLAIEATQAQIDQGIGSLYPYLGGATDASAQLAADAGIPVATPGTARCDEPDSAFAMEVIYDPGEYFAAALQDFKDAKLTMGQVRKWRLGVDDVPAINFCDADPALQEELDAYIAKIADGEIDPIALVKAAG